MEKTGPLWSFIGANYYLLGGLILLSLAGYFYFHYKPHPSETNQSRNTDTKSEKVDHGKEEATKKQAKEMERRHNLYQSAMNLFSETAHEVNKAGSIPLIKELEYIYGGLTSDNLQNILSNSTWNEFKDVITTIMVELKKLKELASKYQRESSEGESDEEKAFRILVIPPTATNEQIKKAYRTHASIWHPDANAVGDDTRIKEINWAYELLKNIRGIK